MKPIFDNICEKRKLLGILAGLILMAIKIALVIVVCRYHIPLGYAPVKSIRLSCIATAVGFGISAFNTLVLLVVKILTLQKLQNFHKPLWFQQYIVTCLCIILLLRFIHIDNSEFSWFKSIICPVILTLEFIFYKLFIEPKRREPVVLITPQLKFLRKMSMKNPMALERSTFTK